jgi:hypothetical protein
MPETTRRRPRDGQRGPRKLRLSIVMSEDERRLIDRYAAREGLATDYFIRRAALNTALHELGMEMIRRRREEVVDRLIEANPFAAAELGE